jgi:carboxyl-terminal processing protease
MFTTRFAGRLRALTGLLLAGGSPAPTAAQPTDTVQLATREQVVRAVHAALTRHFAHRAGVPGFDLDSLMHATAEQARRTPDREAFDLTMLAAVGALRNGHTTFDDPWLWAARGAPLPIGLRWLGGAWIVNVSAVKGLRPGDAVATIDGEPFEQYFQRQRRYVAASSERAARWVFASRAYLFPARFTLGLADGHRVLIERRRAPDPTPAPAAGGAGPAQEVVPHRWLEPDRVAYVRVPYFGQPAYERRALALLGRYRRAPALVLDLRSNGGGSTPWKLRKALVGGRRGDVIARPDLARGGGVAGVLAPAAVALWRVPRYRGQLVVVTNGGCASACEDLVLALKGAPRVLVVGDTTFGSTGEPVVLRFANGMTARVSARRMVYRDGTPFEGVGVAPDVQVAPTATSLAAETDPVLERALTAARERMGSRR